MSYEPIVTLTRSEIKDLNGRVEKIVNNYEHMLAVTRQQATSLCERVFFAGFVGGILIDRLIVWCML